MRASNPHVETRVSSVSPQLQVLCVCLSHSVINAEKCLADIQPETIEAISVIKAIWNAINTFGKQKSHRLAFHRSEKGKWTTTEAEVATS
ncbi:hypothetical protein EVAR_65492_1 [Eumeta japonica]|uniref:Uncharacterized protein n=1 Tax=Eumeta variegata TaxID=151549 RepID=A0A4C2A0T9_EUMVA|nr:hypothetical protein EVAR_65492_1 [Eumeta japonica]